jgi:hypothetical protein
MTLKLVSGVESVQREQMNLFFLWMHFTPEGVLMISNRFSPDLTEEKGLYGYVQQNSALAHTATNSTAAKSEVFSDSY